MITIKDLGNENLGRLGNQLFEIASILGISSSNNHEAFFPKWKYSIFFKNMLNYSDISYERTIYEDEYVNNNFNIGLGNYNLHGFFQSEKYFKEIEDNIRYFFTLKDEYQNIIDSYDMKNTCSLHIRRSDYIGSQIHGALTNEETLIKYINDGLKSIYDCNENPRIIVFSDDINWCRSNLPFKNLEFIEGNNEIIDLFIMSKCENHIISNSTFSWWGAWLNTNKNKKIVTPTPWLLGNDYPLINSNIIPDDWIKIKINEC